MSAPHVVIVHLGRAGGMGAVRRVRGLVDVFEAAGASTSEVRLRVDHKMTTGGLSARQLAATARLDVVPETLSWSLSGVLEHLGELDPDLIVCETARAYSPAFAERWPVILDFVDRLSVSYVDRAGSVPSRIDRARFRALAVPMRRVEQRPAPPGVTRAAVGWADAQALDATWIPMTVESPSNPGTPSGRDRAAAEHEDRAHDLVFFGNLSYAPNIEAVERLSAFWPALQRARPGTSLLVAGARPTDEVRRLAQLHGWALRADVADMAPVLSSARLAVVPLRHASGMQTKVLDAATVGRAQVVSPVALSGFAPGFPAAVADDDASFVRTIVDLLEDPSSLADLGEESRRHVMREYSVDRWSRWAGQELERLGVRSA